ncbi:hypothetical protein DM860_010592 [Cuscuta australis]|uniref:Calmodulin-binding domain-containing protein n=1 Tax=Cuscuta australis TaxID=267555 RepID=A0A328E1J7_9ASTE|nr:hypothetical protein DM860_010592 [Cuscuta australis]
MPDSSPHFIKATACFDAKKETSLVIEQDNGLSSSSSSSSSSPISTRIKNQEGTRKTTKNLGSTRSLMTNPDSGSCLDDGIDQTQSQASSQPSLCSRAVRLSAKSKKCSLRVKSTCASTIKNSKFPGMCHRERLLPNNVCSYRHCSLNKNPSLRPEPDNFGTRKRPSKNPDGKLGMKNRARVQDSESGSSNTWNLVGPNQLAAVQESSDSCKPEVANGENQQGIEVKKLTAVKIVQEAIEKILLPEVSDQPSDSQQMRSDQTTPDQETLENNNENNDLESIPQEVGSGSGECTQTLPLLESRENEIPPEANDTIYQDKKVATEEEPKHISMWHMISQHVLSGVISKAGTGLLEGTDDEEEEDVHTIRETETRRDFSRDDAIGVVKEVVNEILITDIQENSPHTQSRDDSIVNEDGKKQASILAKSNNWSKVKKLVFLKRSIAALQNGKKPEKVNLRHQMMDERKKAEKWMLDYALQNIVTKLTPSRKRRVAMLVEAFEAVVPFPQA